MSDLFEVTIEEQIACIEREIRMREHVYARRVANGAMTQAQSDREMRLIGAVLATLEGIKRP